MLASWRMMTKRKILIMELWGLGDLTFATPVLREALEDNAVSLLAKPYAKELLHPSHPRLEFVHYDAPWTSYRGKYRLWGWRWIELFSLVWCLRKQRFDAAVSVRNDPRDHFFMWLIGARERYGFPWHGSRFFLTHPLTRRTGKQHKIQDWREIGKALGLPHMDEAQPGLRVQGYHADRVEEVLAAVRKPIVCLHAGARITVRRWKEEYFVQLIGQLREHFDFHLLLIPDPDGYGASLRPLADTVLTHLTVRELVGALAHADLLLCNDSGPSHIAACCGRPVITFFGPSDPEWFRPWGDIHKVIVRDICPWRPCFDYCKFAEPYCMTKLMPENVWPEIHDQIKMLVKTGVLPVAMMKPEDRFAETAAPRL